MGEQNERLSRQPFRRSARTALGERRARLRARTSLGFRGHPAARAKRPADRETELVATARDLAAAAIGLAALLIDIFTEFNGAIPVLYMACIVLAAPRGQTQRVIVVGLLCALAACVAFLQGHWGGRFDDAAAQLLANLVAIALTTLLSFLNKLGQEREKRADARYRSIFDKGGFAVWETDWTDTLAVISEAEAQAGGEDLEGWLVAHPEWSRRAGRLVRACELNQEAFRLFGIENPHAMIGKSPGIYAFASDADLARVFAGVARGECVIEGEGPVWKASGERADVALRIARVEPDAARFIGMAIDVTARNEAQTKLAGALAELAHVSRVTTLGQLAASIVHEVSQPLSAVIAYGRAGQRWLQREPPDLRETTESLEQVVDNASRATDVIGRVRDLARRTAPQLQPVELEELIDETLALLRRELLDRGVTVQRRTSPHASAILGDRVQVQQVLMNLILNAAQAMEQTAASKRDVSLEVSEHKEAVSVRIRDHGGGFTGIEPHRVFDPFLSTKAQGLGIGLSICRSIVEAHGGRIWAANVGDGAEVSFLLPVARTDAGRAG